MSKYSERALAITLDDLRRAKLEGRTLSMVTCYDSAFARLVDASTIDIVLVGDSLGNVMLGYDNTIPVTVDDMVHHSAAVARVLKRPFLVVDMPFFSYSISLEQALASACQLVQRGGAQAVKVEGGRGILRQIEAICQAGIPVMGHLGLTPQHVHNLGGYKVQGRGAVARRQLLDDAKAVEAAGASSLVLELVPAELAQEVTETVKIPTIGIGAGPHCDGQVLVLHDLLGFDPGFKPKFLKQYANVGKIVQDALAQFDQDVKRRVFPDQEHSFHDKE